MLAGITACGGEPPTLESLPPVQQLAPEPAATAGGASAQPRLNDEEIDEILRRALADGAVAEALGAGTVDRVYVQTGSGQGVEGRWGTAAFLFDEPVGGWSRPSPWSGMCDIGRPSEDWLGVAANMELGAERAPESSPVWTNGVSCVSFFLPEDEMPVPTRTGGLTEDHD